MVASWWGQVVRGWVGGGWSPEKGVQMVSFFLFFLSFWLLDGLKLSKPLVVFGPGVFSHVGKEVHEDDEEAGWVDKLGREGNGRAGQGRAGQDGLRYRYHWEHVYEGKQREL